MTTVSYTWTYFSQDPTLKTKTLIFVHENRTHQCDLRPLESFNFVFSQCTVSMVSLWYVENDVVYGQLFVLYSSLIHTGICWTYPLIVLAFWAFGNPAIPYRWKAQRKLMKWEKYLCWELNKGKKSQQELSPFTLVWWIVTFLFHLMLIYCSTQTQSEFAAEVPEFCSAPMNPVFSMNLHIGHSFTPLFLPHGHLLTILLRPYPVTDFLQAIIHISIWNNVSLNPADWVHLSRQVHFWVTNHCISNTPYLETNENKFSFPLTILAAG